MRTGRVLYCTLSLLVCGPGCVTVLVPNGGLSQCEPSALLAADSLRFLLFGKLNVEGAARPYRRARRSAPPGQASRGPKARSRETLSEYKAVNKSKRANENPKKRRATGDSRDTTNCLCSDLTPYLELSPQLTLSTQNLMAVLQISQAGESCLVLPNSFVPFVRGDGTSASSSGRCRPAGHTCHIS